MLTNHIHRIGFAVVYLGLMMMVAAFKLPLSMLATPLVGLFLIATCTLCLPGKVTNHQYYKGMLIAATVAMLVSPFMMLQIVEVTG